MKSGKDRLSIAKVYLDAEMKNILVSLSICLFVATMTSVAVAQQATNNLGVFQGIVAAKKAEATQAPNAFMYAARPEYSQPSLSPLGTRVAIINRQDESVTTLAILDISGKEVTPIFKLEIPCMESIRSYGWTNEDRLAVWADINAEHCSSEENPRSSFYIATLDLKTKKVSERMQSNQITSEPVRAPWKDQNHILINECYQKQPVKSKTHLDEADFNIPNADTLPSNTIYCRLLDWDLEKNKVSNFADPVYGFPIRFLSNRTGDKMFYETRKLGGEMQYSNWDAKAKKWLPEVSKKPSELQEIWDSSELDYPEIWAKIHKLLPDRLNPAGNVVKTSNTSQPLGVQFTSPDLRFGPFDNDSQSAQNMLAGAFGRYKIFSGATIKWLGATDDRSTILFSVDSAINPGTYYVWHRIDNTIVRVTHTRTLTEDAIGETYMEPSWLPGYLPVAVTPARNIKQSKGMVLMPIVVDDVVAAAELHSVNLTAEWFAANGLTVVRVPVGLPPSITKVKDGDIWRKQVGKRIAAVAKNVRKEFKLDEFAPACVYGKDAAAYASLAALAYGSSLHCAIAFNPRLDSTFFKEPYPRMRSSGKTPYLLNDNITLRLWSRMYGSNVATGTPGAWAFPANSEVMIGYEMFDDQIRMLSSLDGGLSDAVSKTAGTVTRYTANTNASLADQWLATQYEAMIAFMFPPEVGKVGRVYVGELEVVE